MTTLGARTATTLASAVCAGWLLLGSGKAHADACGLDVRVDLPACASSSSTREGKLLTITVDNDCPKDISVKFDIANGKDYAGRAPAGTQYVFNAHLNSWRYLRDVKCCPRGIDGTIDGNCDQSLTISEIQAQQDAFRKLCEWTWKHDSQVGWSCTYNSLAANEEDTRCEFSGVRCWDFVSADVDNGDLALTTAQIEVARNCGGLLTPGGDCSVHAPTEEELAQKARDDFHGYCEWKWKHDSFVGYSCTYASLRSDFEASLCSFTDPSCWDFVDAGVDNEGTFTLTIEEIGKARNCSGLFTPGGDCSVHDDEEEEESPPVVLALDQRKANKRAECEAAWDKALAECRYASMQANDEATHCLVGEPILCVGGAQDREIPNWTGKTRWTPAEIRAAGNCDGQLRLEGCPYAD